MALSSRMIEAQTSIPRRREPTLRAELEAGGLWQRGLKTWLALCEGLRECIVLSNFAPFRDVDRSFVTTSYATPEADCLAARSHYKSPGTGWSKKVTLRRSARDLPAPFFT
jgi:hypothetical protein